MNTQQKLLNDINRKIGYTGEDLSLQSASNWLAENVHLINGSTGGGGIVSNPLPENYIFWNTSRADVRVYDGGFVPVPNPNDDYLDYTLDMKNFEFYESTGAYTYTGEEELWFDIDIQANIRFKPKGTSYHECTRGLRITYYDGNGMLGKYINLMDAKLQPNVDKIDVFVLRTKLFLKKGARIFVNARIESAKCSANLQEFCLNVRPDIHLNFKEEAKRNKTQQPKAPYVGDFMTTQTALNYIAENIGTGGGGTGGAVTADDILRLMNNLGNVKMTKSGNQLQLQCDDNPTGDGIYGKTKEGRWEHIPSGAGGSIADFRLDENDPFGVKIVFDDGSHKTVNLLGMHREFPKGHAFQFQDVLKYAFHEAKWSHITQLGKDYMIPLGTFKEKYYKGGIRFKTEGDKHILHFPEGNLTVKSKLDIEATWKKWPEVSEEPYNKGVYTRTMKAFLRRQGSTTWELAGSKSYSWNEEYGKYMPCGVNLRGVELSFTLPDTPCDVYFTYCFDRFGDNPWEFLSMPLYFGVRDFDDSPGTLPAGTGFFITTTKVMNDDWIPHP